MNTKIFTLALIASAFLPAAASAESGRESVSSEVPYHDLNLADAGGQKRFDQRIATTVRRMCGVADVRSLAERENVTRCRREAFADAASGRNLALASITRRANVALAPATSPLLGK